MTDYVCDPQIYDFKLWVFNITRAEFNTTFNFTSRISTNNTVEESKPLELKPGVENRTYIMGKVLINIIRRD